MVSSIAFTRDSYTCKQIQRRWLISWSHGLLSGWMGVLHYMEYIGMCGPKGYGFLAVLGGSRVSTLSFWSEIGCGLCVLNWAFFWGNVTSAAFGDKTINKSPSQTITRTVRQRLLLR